MPGTWMPGVLQECSAVGVRDRPHRKYGGRLLLRTPSDSCPWANLSVGCTSCLRPCFGPAKRAGRIVHMPGTWMCQVLFRNAQRWACEIGRTENTVVACSCVLRVILAHEPIFGWGVPNACGRALDQPSVQDASCIRLDEIFCILILYLVFLFSFFSLFCHLFLGWCYISAVFEWLTRHTTLFG